MKDYKTWIAVCIVLFILQMGSAVTIKLIYHVQTIWLIVGGILSIATAFYLMIKDGEPLT